MDGVCLSSGCSSYLNGPVGLVFTAAVTWLFQQQCLIGEDWPDDDSNATTDLNFDYIIVGAGSAGSLIASRLSEDSCRKILLIEAGGDPPLESNFPATAAAMQKSAVDWQYQYESDGVVCKGMVNQKCNLPRGKMLGGSGSLNGLLAVRGHKINYDKIAANGNYGWNYYEALKYFKKTENLTDSAIRNDPYFRNFHGYTGPLGVDLFHSTNPVGQALINGYKQIGSREVIDVNGPSNNGTVRLLGTVKGGRRDTTARSLLLPAADRDNLILFKNTLVTKIVFDGNVAVGVVMRFANGTEVQATASKEVILSAGAINTPQLLMLSGIGPKTHLESFNITVIADRPVGQNLDDHPMAPVVVTINEGAPPLSQQQAAMDVAQYITNRTGVYAQNGLLDISTFMNTGFDRTNPPNIQTHHLFFTTNAPQLVRYCRLVLSYNDDICNSFFSYNANSQILNILVTLLDQRSRGNIQLASTDPTVYPKINSNFFRSDEDVNTIINGIKYVTRLVNTPSLRALGAQIRRINITECNSLKLESDQYWRCIIFNMGSTLYHPMGTAKMGPCNDNTAVVDPELRVCGTEKLRVIDASVIPVTISGNINIPTIMFAERGSDLIKNTYDNDACANQ